VLVETSPIVRCGEREYGGNFLSAAD